MTDSRLQQLKRAWEASGSTEDEAAYLLERVRSGDLTQERLELAAYCGNEGARQVAQVPLEDASAAGLVSRAERLGAVLFELDVVQAASVAHGLAAHYLPRWEASFPEVREPRLALEAVSAWHEAPGQSLRIRAFEAGLAAELAVSEATLHALAITPAVATGFGCAYVALSLGREHEFALNHPLRVTRRASSEAFSALLEADPQGFWSRERLQSAGSLLLSESSGSLQQ